jgi:hypothetical protein
MKLKGVPEPVTLYRIVRASGAGRRTGQRHLTPRAVGDITPDQQASCPKDLAVMVGLFAFEIGQFEVAPVVQSRSFGSGTGRQTPPVRSSLRLCDLLGGADNPLRLAP